MSIIESIYQVRKLGKSKAKEKYTHGASKSSQELVHLEMFLHSRIGLEFGNVGF